MSYVPVFLCRSGSPPDVFRNDLRPAVVSRPHSASTPSSLVTADIVHNRALITHCQRISQSNRPPHHAHSTTRPFSHSLSNSNLLDDGLAPTLLFSSTMTRSNLSLPPTFLATFSNLVPFLCAVVLPAFSPPSLVLLAENGSTDSKVLGEQQSQLPTAVSWKGARMVHAFALELLRL